jgi:hypothetical protein
MLEGVLAYESNIERQDSKPDQEDRYQGIVEGWKLETVLSMRISQLRYSNGKLLYYNSHLE